MISRIRALWNNLFRRKQLDRDLEDELQAYVELSANESVKDGAGLAHVRENVRDVRVGVSLDRLAQDIRYGVRTLAKNPAFTLVATTTLALGIGANTAMFSLLDQVVLRLLPIRHPEQLVIVRETGNHYGNSYGRNTVSWPMFEDLRNNNRVFSGMFCRFPATVNLGYRDRAAQISAELVSGSYFPTLGIGAVLGRTIAPDDDAVPDSKPVVVLSYSFWRSYFDGDRTIVGRTIAL
ncbi:MAG: ABC transporter permease, partial [Bryobacteraceae bacterium]